MKSKNFLIKNVASKKCNPFVGDWYGQFKTVIVILFENDDFPRRVQSHSHFSVISRNVSYENRISSELQKKHKEYTLPYAIAIPCTVGNWMSFLNSEVSELSLQVNMKWKVLKSVDADEYVVIYHNKTLKK